MAALAAQAADVMQAIAAHGYYLPDIIMYITLYMTTVYSNIICGLMCKELPTLPRNEDGRRIIGFKNLHNKHQL